MIAYLKRGKDEAALAEADAGVRATVEKILDDVKQRGDAAAGALPAAGAEVTFVAWRS